MKPFGLPFVRPFVFLGPSLPVAEARAILDAVYLPPVSMGDVYRLMARQPTTVAIVDGLFEQTPAVWHKEILFALSRGVRVLGASSMGALRAAELAAFGMEGVGEVFQAFASGALEDDDEVAVAHASAADGYRSLSDAMVNIRAGLREAQAAGALTVDTHDRLIAAAKALFYPDRSWPRLFQIAAADPRIPSGELAALRDRIGRHRPDVKRADALRLLAHLASGAGAGQATGPAPAPIFDFEPTYFWEQLILHEDVAAATDDQISGADGAIGLAALRRHVRLDPARAREPLATALLMYLAEEQADRRGLPLPVDVQEDASASASPGGGAGDAAAGAPADRERLTTSDRALHARGRAATDAVLRAAADQVNRRLPAALAHLGRLPSVLVEVRRKQDALRALGLRAASPADAGVTLEALLDWHQKRSGPLAGSPEAHAEQAGFVSLEEFVAELALEYLVAHAR